MCWLIFASVSGFRGDPVQVFKARGYTAEVSRNPTCEHLDLQGVLTVRDSNCSCLLYIPTQRYVGENTALMRARFLRKGWPKDKVERVVKARCAASEKRAAGGAHNVFPSIVTELVEAGAEVTLLAHFFDGSFDEPFAVRARRKLTLFEYLGNGGAFPEDELVAITR